MTRLAPADCRMAPTGDISDQTVQILDRAPSFRGLKCPRLLDDILKSRDSTLNCLWLNGPSCLNRTLDCAVDGSQEVGDPRAGLLTEVLLASLLSVQRGDNVLHESGRVRLTHCRLNPIVRLDCLCRSYCRLIGNVRRDLRTILWLLDLPLHNVSFVRRCLCHRP